MTGPDNDNKVQTYSLQTKGIKLVCQNAAKSSDYETNTILFILPPILLIIIIIRL